MSSNANEDNDDKQDEEEKETELCPLTFKCASTRLQNVVHTSVACPGPTSPFEGSTVKSDAASPRLTLKANAMSYFPLKGAAEV